MTYVETVVEALKSAVEKMAIDQRVEKLAYYDALTSLPNRMAILQRMDDAIEEARATDGRMASCFWTSTALRASTIRSDIAAATSSLPKSRNGCAAPCAVTSTSGGSAATSSQS